MDNFKLSFVHIIDDVVVFDCSLSFSKINRKLTEKVTGGVLLQLWFNQEEAEV